MTEQEAIEELRTSIDLAKMCTQNYERKKEVEAYNMAIKALEKQVTKKPTRTKDKETEIIFYFCPNCKKTIGTDIVKYQSNNCSYCGQKLDWEGGE